MFSPRLQYKASDHRPSNRLSKTEKTCFFPSPLSSPIVNTHMNVFGDLRQSARVCHSGVHNEQRSKSVSNMMAATVQREREREATILSVCTRGHRHDAVCSAGLSSKQTQQQQQQQPPNSALLTSPSSPSGATLRTPRARPGPGWLLIVSIFASWNEERPSYDQPNGFGAYVTASAAVTVSRFSVSGVR
jgi:hypothetical protein